MIHWFLGFAFVSLVSSLPLVGILFPLLVEASTCACEKIVCSPCEKQVKLHFYTEKCAGNQLKSCSKPICEALDNPPEQCKPSQAESSPNIETQPLIKKIKQKTPVGSVVMSMGPGTVVQEGNKTQLKVGLKIFNDDEIETSESGRAKVLLKDESTVTLLPNSKTKINVQMQNPLKNSATSVDLIFGTIRSVVSRGDGAEKKFNVQTNSAVAGVRGTDFLTTYYESSQITKVQTLEGLVELSSRTGHAKTLIGKGQHASFVVDTQSPTPSSSMKYVEQGFITPVSPIEADHLKEIDKKFRFDGDSHVVVSHLNETPICSNPSALFNQCAFQCINNPRGAKECQVSEPNVRCQRRRCNANGQWAEETRLPASEWEKCHPKEITIGKCDY